MRPAPDIEPAQTVCRPHPEVISQFRLNARITAAMAVPSAPLFSLLHRLIPVIILSSKIPVTVRICKESVKVCPSKSLPSADDSAFDLFPG